MNDSGKGQKKFTFKKSGGLSLKKNVTPNTNQGPLQNAMFSSGNTNKAVTMATKQLPLTSCAPKQTSMHTFFGAKGAQITPAAPLQKKVACVAPMSTATAPTTVQTNVEAVQPISSTGMQHKPLQIARPKPVQKKSPLPRFPKLTAVDDEEDFEISSYSPVAERGGKRTSGQMEVTSDGEHSPVVKKRKTRSIVISDEEDSNQPVPGVTGAKKIQDAALEFSLKSEPHGQDEEEELMFSQQQYSPPPPGFELDAFNRDPDDEGDLSLLDRLSQEELVELEQQDVVQHNPVVTKPEPVAQQPVESRAALNVSSSASEAESVRASLFTVMEQMCELISHMSMDDMLALTSIDTGQLQQLSRHRKQLKLQLQQLGHTSTALTASATHASNTPSARKPLFKTPLTQLPTGPSPISSIKTEFNPASCANRLSATSTPMTSCANTSHAMTSHGKSFTSHNSPVPPCGESFFEAPSPPERTSSKIKFEANTSNVSLKTSVLTRKSPGTLSSHNSNIKTPGLLSGKKYNFSSFEESDLNDSDNLSSFHISPPKHDNTSVSKHQTSTSAAKGLFKFDYSISNQSSSKSRNSFGRADTSTNEPGFAFGDSEDFGNLVEEFDTQALPVNRNLNVNAADISLFRTPLKQTQQKTPIKSPASGKFLGHHQDDGSDPHFSRQDFKHSAAMMDIFHSTFGLRSFRKNQLPAINAALLGHDTFVLMPTGGGKSLCYQLPAAVTPGVTIVISPLKSLIQDQVQKLQSLNISAYSLSGELTPAQSDQIYVKLSYRAPDVRLLFVTPEKLQHSEKLMGALQRLYQRQLLCRFVIDEAHCVSQWGHDFRPDYTQLHVLRERFSGVPMMALTATATPRVRHDILHQLRMHQPKWFMQSFNRENLKYEVKTKKGKKTGEEVVNLILQKFPGQSGIVYCLSRNECDQTASLLQRAGISAEAYHGGLADSKRTRVQNNWINERGCKVICATIAFGMGIDKPDVRFVIHYSLPKSVEGLYQESGRAGRDGKPATCVMFYSYGDVARHRKLIEMPNKDSSMSRQQELESKRVHLDNLYRMVQYCENQADCRRAQLLQYFGEVFDKQQCRNMPEALCDNCAAQRRYKTEDLTEQTRRVLRSMEGISSKGRGRGTSYTLIHYIDVFKGSKNAKVLQLGHDKLAMHGLGEQWPRTDVERYFRHLVIKGILTEYLATTAQDHTVCYAVQGKKARDVLNGSLPVPFQVVDKRSSALEAAKAEQQEQENPLYAECYQQLIELARNIAQRHGYKNYAHTVFDNGTMDRMSRALPLTLDEMANIDGVPKYKLDRFGEEFLTVTQTYAAMHASLQDELEEQAEENAFEGNGTLDSEPEFLHEPGATGQKSGYWGKSKYGKKKGYSRKNVRQKSANRANKGAAGKKTNFGQFKYKKGAAANGSSKTSTASKSYNSSSSFTPASASATRRPGMLSMGQQPRSFLAGPSSLVAKPAKKKISSFL